MPVQGLSSPGWRYIWWLALQRAQPSRHRLRPEAGLRRGPRQRALRPESNDRISPDTGPSGPFFISGTGSGHWLPLHPRPSMARLPG